MDHLDLLYIENDQEHADRVIAMLENHQIICSIKHLRDGKQAHDYLFNINAPSKNPHPKVILTDLQLPDSDGFELLKAIKQDEHLHWIPVIVLTSMCAENDILQAYQCGANSYLIKPADDEKLDMMLRILSDYWFQQNLDCSCIAIK